jgi:hypothetical protein
MLIPTLSSTPNLGKWYPKRIRPETTADALDKAQTTGNGRQSTTPLGDVNTQNPILLSPDSHLHNRPRLIFSQPFYRHSVDFGPLLGPAFPSSSS